MSLAVIIWSRIANGERSLLSTQNTCNNRNWELLAPWEGSKITVPSKFIIGSKDIGFEANGTKEYVLGEIFKSLVPNLEVVILDGHHFIQQEKPQEATNEIFSFLCKFSVNQ